uniref:Haloacid dehalogenase-like hydrolase domain-containing protein 3 n=1 Tax=Nelumbo nucifera TaxID=4432 RepID=A0A822ZDS5_NELNU|nr:TPA_asm: hypothetical protein HUJ06_000963 [Nelumbo nucifera]
MARILRKLIDGRSVFAARSCSNVLAAKNQSNPFKALSSFSYSSSSSTSSKEAEVVGFRQLGLEFLGAKDYYDYRRSLYGDITHRALLVDAVGTLLVPSQPTAQIYRQIGEKYGVQYSEDEILNRYRWAYGQPWGRSRLRFALLSLHISHL